MPRPKRAAAVKPTNYSDADNSKELEEESVVETPIRATIEQKESVAAHMGDDQVDGQAGIQGEKDAEEDRNKESENVPSKEVKVDATQVEGGSQPEPNAKEALPQTPPPHGREPSSALSAASAEDGGEYVPDAAPESDMEPDIKPKVSKRGSASPAKRKAAGTAGGSPSKSSKGNKNASPAKSENGGTGKFESTPENRGAILHEMLRHVPTTKMNWKAVGDVTGDNPQKLAKVSRTPIVCIVDDKADEEGHFVITKYYDQTFKKHLDAAVRSQAFRGAAKK